jgi:crotonobetainyl-CoA:carnitine CoA-transferase CaiB-like acyl-CoA transferase
MPLAEAFVPVLGEFVLDYTMNGRVTPPQGNAHRHHAPHGVYPTVGDDQWIAIDVGSDDEFRSLCEVLDAPALAADERFADAAARLRNRDALDAWLRDLTCSHDKEHLFRALQAVGVIAAPLHDELEALADEQLNARGWFREITMPGVGTHRYPGYVFKLRNTADDVRLPPARLGEHSEAIYLDLLGYSRAEYDALFARGFVGTKYAAGVAP